MHVHQFFSLGLARLPFLSFQCLRHLFYPSISMTGSLIRPNLADASIHIYHSDVLDLVVGRLS